MWAPKFCSLYVDALLSTVALFTLELVVFVSSLLKPDK